MLGILRELVNPAMHWIGVIHDTGAASNIYTIGFICKGSKETAQLYTLEWIHGKYGKNLPWSEFVDGEGAAYTIGKESSHIWVDNYICIELYQAPIVVKPAGYH